MTIPGRRAAREHIESIRAGKGLRIDGETPPNVADLEKALDVLSTQLYQNSTHFLLEMIQNADDNQYASRMVPSLEIQYEKGFLRIDCNEIGFSPENVDAICRIGNSTKAGQSAKDTTGEKGIGFKSVFAAADIVWVSSNDYSFKFEKNTPLGMIAPKWDPLPRNIQPRAGFTTFYLQLSSTFDTSGLITYLRALDERLLMFLRRLKNIELNVLEDDGLRWTRTLQREDVNDRSGNEVRFLTSSTIDQEGTRTVRQEYLLFRARATGMPATAKRPGQTTSDIVLVFPIDTEGKPRLGSEQVYAYLPIRDYGLGFLIQADFFLVANREDIDQSSSWNLGLRNACVQAFTAAVHRFNFRNDPLRHTWLQFLPSSQHHTDNYFLPLKRAIFRNLRTERVLECVRGQMAPPHTLTYVPAKFLDHEGQPITRSDLYLSQKYDAEDWEHLKALGVVEMTPERFLEDLKTYMATHKAEFQAKSHEWHSRLAEILNDRKLFGAHKDAICELPLIPLRDGQWISGKDGDNSVYFPGDTRQRDIPPGIHVLVVDTSAVTGGPRYALFRTLGVHNFEPRLVCEAIERKHSAHNWDARTAPRSELVAQVHFLFSVGWSNPRRATFWFATERDERMPATRIYQDSNEPYSASKVFKLHRQAFQFLHTDYVVAETDPQTREIWLRWLFETMNVTTLPRLVRKTSPSGITFEISRDFQFILQRQGLEFLFILVQHWRHERIGYGQYLEEDEDGGSNAPWEASVKKLKQVLGSQKVKCTTGALHRLDQTFLPTQAIRNVAGDLVPYLDITEPESRRWQYLAALGVGVKPGITLFLRALENLSGQMNALEVATYLLEQVQASCHEDEQAVRASFQGKNLVFIPMSGSGTGSRWVRAHQCVWKGPKCLRTFECLKDIYPGAKRLFCTVLGVKDASLDDVVKEAKHFQPVHRLPYILSIFQEMEKALEQESSDSSELVESSIASLKGCNAFPISSTTSPSDNHELKNANKATEWFISDRVPLRESFDGLIPLLCFSSDDISQLQRVVKALGLHTRKLSKAAKSVPKTVGDVRSNPKLTQLFRARADFIVRLIPVTKANVKDRRLILKRLRNLEVHTADQVIQEWTVKSNKIEVTGRPKPGHVVLTAEGEVLKIYLAKNYFEDEHNPEELVEELFCFCGMDRKSSTPKDAKYCLQVILTEKTNARIQAILESNGAPSLESLRLETLDMDPDPESDDEMSAPTPRAAPSIMSRSTAAQGTSRFGRHGFVLGTSSNFDTIFINNAGGSGGNGGFDFGFAIQDDDTASLSSSMASVSLGSGRDRSLRMFSMGSLRAAHGRRARDETIKIKGEKFVSDSLQTWLGTNYVPDNHWTSKLRHKAQQGLPEYYGDENGTSTFTIPDHSGAFTRCLIEENLADANQWLDVPPVYHIEVKTTVGDIRSEFFMTNAQFDRSRKYSVSIQDLLSEGGIPTDVFILMRVFDVETAPKLVPFVDVWELFCQGKLRMMGSGDYTAKFKV